jgi:DNA-3-methyladenine glycosylase
MASLTTTKSARIGRKFFQTDSVTLAKRVLGQRLVRVLPDGSRLSGLIVETEAYLGLPDRASHAFGLRRTARNEAMYREGGTAYVYFTYGMHFCFNIVCGRVDEPLAVLIRALEPREGLDEMRVRRSGKTGNLPDSGLCSGPAKLCQALEIDRRLNGIDLVHDERLFLERARRTGLTDNCLLNTPRIGVGYAQEWALRPLRWLVRDNPHVSRTKTK